MMGADEIKRLLMVMGRLNKVDKVLVSMKKHGKKALAQADEKAKSDSGAKAIADQVETLNRSEKAAQEAIVEMYRTAMVAVGKIKGPALTLPEAKKSLVKSMARLQKVDTAASALGKLRRRAEEEPESGSELDLLTDDDCESFRFHYARFKTELTRLR